MYRFWSIASVSPDHVPEHTETPIQIDGDHLRPFLDVRFGTIPSGGLFLKGPTRAEVIVPDLPAGTYDVVLVDAGRVMVRKSGALTVVAPPASVGAIADLQAVGTFIGLNETAARSVAAGTTFASTLPAYPSERRRRRHQARLYREHSMSPIACRARARLRPSGP